MFRPFTTSPLFSTNSTFAYDDLHRLTAADHPAAAPLADETFAYDAVGNRLADARITGYTYDAANRLLENASFTYGYDADGNMTGKTDKNTLQTTTYGYDSENRLVSVSLPGGENWTYKYDGQGRRVEKSSGSLPGEGTRYVYDGQAILASTALDNTLTAAFTHGPRIDEPLLIRQADGAEHAAHAGLLGSIVAHTSASGQVVERIDYEAYGTPTFSDLRSGSPVTREDSLTGSPFAFTAREHDRESGHYHYRSRSYDPPSSRFLQEDPLGLHGGDINLYAYVSNRPTKHSDPTGTTYKSNYFFLRDWVYGFGGDSRFYGPNSMESQEMSRSPAAEKLRAQFCEGGNKTLRNLNYGTFEAFYDTVLSRRSDLSSTAFQVGGFAGAYAVNNGDGTVSYIVKNQAGAHSFFYHAVPNQPFSFGPMRTITQVFVWTEPINNK